MLRANVKSLRNMLALAVGRAERDISAGLKQFDEILNSLMTQCDVAIQKLDWLVQDKELLDGPLPQNAIAKHAKIVETVVRHSGVTETQILGQSRRGRVVRPRHVVFWALHRYAGMTLAEVGRRYGDRDHSTVHHAVTQVERELKDGGQRGELARLVIRELLGEV